MREGEFRNVSGCAIACIFHSDAALENGTRIRHAMEMMHDRSNGLGGGFVAYGIYPKYADAYAFHVFYDDEVAKQACEKAMKQLFHIVCAEKIPTRKQERISSVP